jgi:hypothetical protein
LGAGLTVQPCKKVIVKKPQRGGQGLNWAVEPYDDGYIMNNERCVGRYLEESECDVFKTLSQRLFADNQENRGKP